MDALQQAKDCMTELGEIKPYDYDGKEITLQHAQTYAAIAQAQALAKIADNLEAVAKKLDGMLDAYIQVHF